MIEKFTHYNEDSVIVRKNIIIRITLQPFPCCGG